MTNALRKINLTIPSTFKAYVYGWRNIKTGFIRYGRMYIGYAGRDEIYDGYKFSSDDADLIADYGRGYLRRSILFYANSIAEAITMERKLLKYADARHNVKFYNKSNGGGANLLDYKTITDEEAAVGIDWINGIDPIYEVDTYNFVDNELVSSILKNVKDGKYEVKQIDVKEISTYKQNQVRLVMIDHNHQKGIVDKMIENPSDARNYVQPIIVSVDKDANCCIIEGNHTYSAAQEANWKEAPVIFLNTSEFHDNQSNIDQFGVFANHTPILKKPNSSHDCQRAIINLYNNNLAKNDDADFSVLQGEKFKNTCLKIWGIPGVWSNKTIVSSLKQAINRLRTDKAIADLNFQLYSKKELNGLVESIEKSNPNLPIITITSGAVYNAGVGGIMNKMGSMKCWKGLLVVHHNDIHEYETWKESETKLKNALQLLKNKCKIKYVLLNSFKKQTKITI